MRRNLTQDFNASMDGLRFSQEAKEDMVQRLMECQKEQTMYRNNRKKVILIALAAALILVTMTGAAVFTRWSNSAQNKYQPTQQQKAQAESIGLSSLLETHAAGDSLTCVTDQGITITAVQTIVDQYSAMIVLRIDGFDLPMGETPSLTISSAEITNVHTVIPPGRFHDGIFADPSGNKVYQDGSAARYHADGTVIPKYADSDGSLEYYTIFTFSKGNLPVGEEIQLTISAIGTEGKPSLVQGDWNLRWTLSGTTDIRHYQTDTPIANTGVTLLEVEISPISIFTVYKMDNADGHIHNNDPSSNSGRKEAHETIEFLMTGIRMKDGTIHKLGPATGINSMYSDAGVGIDYPAYYDDILQEKAVLLTKSRLIGQIVDPEEVDALLFQESVPVEKEITEIDPENCLILTLP